MSDILQVTRPPYRSEPRAGGPSLEPDTELLTPATQIVGDADAYLGSAAQDIGRRVSDDQLELFVVCQPAEALLQQFARLTPDFIAIHDLGTTLSARLLAAVATAAKSKLQRLVIRRQGFGTALATLQFVELPLPGNRRLRVYTTAVDSDTRSRQQLAQALLAHSRLAAVLVGEQPAHLLDRNLQLLREAIAAGRWPNRELLLVPLANLPSLAAQASLLAAAGGGSVRTTPQAARATDAWSYITGAWNRLNAAATPAAAVPVAAAAAPLPAAAHPAVAATSAAAAAALLAEDPGTPAFVTAYAPTRPLELSPMPAPRAGGTAQPRSPHQDRLWSDYVLRCAALDGVVQACVFDLELQRPLAYSGTLRAAERLAAKGALLLTTIADTAAAVAAGTTPQEATVTLDAQRLLLRPMPGRPGVALHLVLERGHGGLEPLRAALRQIDQALLPGSA